MILNPKVITFAKSSQSYLFALAGVMIFSLSFPMTKFAVAELNPYFVVSARSLIAGVLGLLWLAPKISNLFIVRQKLVKPVLWQILGVVIGFPLFSSVALESTGASHAALVIAIVPIMTAIISVLSSRKKKSIHFWAFAIVASITVFMTAIYKNGIQLQRADFLLLIASILVSLGYAFGSQLASFIGGVSAISLATVFVLPASFVGVLYFWPQSIPSWQAIFSVGYLGFFSMFIGFVFWYQGLSIGPTEQVSLVQSFQLFFTFIASNILLQEPITYIELLPAFIIFICILGARLSK